MLCEDFIKVAPNLSIISLLIVIGSQFMASVFSQSVFAQCSVLHCLQDSLQFLLHCIVVEIIIQ